MVVVIPIHSKVDADNIGIVYSGSAGRIDFDTASKPFSAETHTWLASATKIITCTALMQLVERGQIKLHDDVRPLIPELADMQILRGFDSEDRPILEDNTEPITLWYDKLQVPLDILIQTGTSSPIPLVFPLTSRTLI